MKTPNFFQENKRFKKENDDLKKNKIDFIAIRMILKESWMRKLNL